MLIIVYGAGDSQYDRARAMRISILNAIHRRRVVSAFDDVSYLDTREKWYPKSGNQDWEAANKPRHLVTTAEVDGLATLGL